jgi:hypothetical protein
MPHASPKASPPKRPRRPALAPRSPTQRSRVTNGADAFIRLPGLDQRGAIARRARDIMANFISALGGEDALTEMQMQLVRRATRMAIKCEVMESKANAGLDIDDDLHGRISDRLRRVLQTLGLHRVMKDITPDQRARELIEAGLA